MTKPSRGVAACLALAALFALAATAFADNAGIHMVCKQVRFRTSATSNTNSDPTFNARGGYVDSLTFNRIGRGSTTAGSDTTAPISLQGLAPYMGGSSGATALLDSMQFVGRLVIEDAGGSTAVDSVYVLPQVSGIGGVWVSLGNGVTVPKQATQGAPGYGCSSLDAVNAAVAQKIFSFPLLTGSSFATGRGQIELSNWRGFPLIRFIIQNDGSSATVVHNYRATFCYWSNRETDNE